MKGTPDVHVRDLGSLAAGGIGVMLVGFAGAGGGQDVCSARGDVERHPDAQVFEDVPGLRIESGLYFANADAIRARIVKGASAEGVQAALDAAQSA